MPELPEIEVYRRALERKFRGRKISTAEYHRQKRLNVPPEQLKAAVEGAKLSGVDREGKALVLRLSNDHWLRLHLMLNGSVSITDDPESVRNKVLTLEFGDHAMVLADPRGLAMVGLDAQSEEGTPDALVLSWQDFQAIMDRKAAANVKAVLNDQGLILGIGNAYSDEILWHARVSPKSTVGAIPEDRRRAIFEAIGRVLNEAISHLEKLDGSRGMTEARDFLSVHQKSRPTSPTGGQINVETVAGKKTYFTDEQVEYGRSPA